jgi:alpha-L-fucosidase
VNKRIFFGTFLLVALQGFSQSSGKILQEGFENGMASWTSSGVDNRCVANTAHSGKYCLQVPAGGRVSKEINLLPNHEYKFSIWLKTASGSDEIQLNAKGLNGNDVSGATALTDWTNIERKFTTSSNQKKVTIEIYHPENAGKNPAWADDFLLMDLGVNKEIKVSGIQPLPARIPQNEYGIMQQPNDKVKWLVDARFGMFIHWGLYAGPASGEWYMENKPVPIDTYRELAYPASGGEYFSADKFNADDWAALAKSAGMKYMCLTAMHHDGFALFDSRYINSFTSKQTLNHDFVKEYTDACRKAGLKVGLYKTLINWRYPGYYDVNGTDAKKNSWGYVADMSHQENARQMKEGLYNDVKQLMTGYGKIDMIFWDGGWLGQQGSDADAAYFWEPGKFLDTTNKWPVNKFFQDTDVATGKPLGIMGIVRKYQPDILVNPRASWMGDYMSEEGGAPITGPVRSKEIWQKCMTVGGAWGYSSAMEDSTKMISFDQLKRMLADVVIRNMSLLLNVGPDRHGVISKPVSQLLQRTGDWLHDRKETIYGTFGGPWNPKDGEYGFAYRDSTIYVFLLDNFKGNTITLPSVNKGQHVIKVYEVGIDSKLKFSQNKNREITIRFSPADDNIRIFAVKLNREVMSSEL